MQTNRPEQQLQQKTGPTETTHAFFHQQPSVLINTECNNVHKFYKRAYWEILRKLGRRTLRRREEEEAAAGPR